MSVDAHFAELAPVAARLGIKDVYLSSDSGDRIAEAIAKYGAEYTMHFIPWSRPQGGYIEDEEKEAWRMRDIVRLTLADVFIKAQADVMVGTLSSNQGRLADEFRVANGKGWVPFLTPEAPQQSDGAAALK